MKNLAIFCKYPQPGKVKTRLASAVGEQLAADIYRSFLNSSIDLAKKLKCDYQLVFSPEDQHKLFQEEFLAPSYLAQCAGDLSARLRYCFEWNFQQGLQSLVIIGSDSPDLPEDYLQATFEVLEQHKAVLGPAHDGGYYLIGLQKEAYHRELFSNITWSSDQVFTQTLQNFENAGSGVVLLPEWHDVDELDDVQLLLKRGYHLPEQLIKELNL